MIEDDLIDRELPGRPLRRVRSSDHAGRRPAGEQLPRLHPRNRAGRHGQDAGLGRAHLRRTGRADRQTGPGDRGGQAGLYHARAGAPSAQANGEQTARAIAMLGRADRQRRDKGGQTPGTGRVITESTFPDSGRPQPGQDGHPLLPVDQGDRGPSIHDRPQLRGARPGPAHRPAEVHLELRRQRDHEPTLGPEPDQKDSGRRQEVRDDRSHGQRHDRLGRLGRRRPTHGRQFGGGRRRPAGLRRGDGGGHCPGAGR